MTEVTNQSQDLPSSYPHGSNNIYDQLNEAYNIFASSTRELFEANKDEAIEQVIVAIEIQDFRTRENYIRSAKIKKEVFVAGVVFLQKIFNIRSPTSEMILKKKRVDEVRDLMLKMIIAASPSFCNNCTMVFSSESISRLRCFSCDAGLCPHCVTAHELEAAKKVLKNIATVCDECLWTFAHPGQTEDSHEESSPPIPPIPSSQSIEDDALTNTAMIELDDEAEEDVPLIIDPKAAIIDPAIDNTQFPEDDIFNKINTTVITINSQNESTFSPPRPGRISPEKSKIPSSPAKKPSADTRVAEELTPMPNMPIKETSVVNSTPTRKTDKPHEIQTCELVRPVVNNSSKKLIISNTSRINIVSTISSVNENVQSSPQNEASADIIVSEEAPSVEAASEVVSEEAPFVEVVSAKKAKNDKKLQDEKNEKNSDDVKKTENCFFYMQFKCKFGRWGEQCTYEHPKMCFSYMREGTKGCSKGEECQFMHPKMCKKSLDDKKCSSKGCKLSHFKYLLDSPNKDSKKDLEKESSTKKPNFRVSASKGSKMKKSESQIPPLFPPPGAQHTQQSLSPLPPAPPPPAPTEMDSLITTLRALQNQMSTIMIEAKTGREEINSLKSLIHQPPPTPTPQLCLPPPPITYAQVTTNQTPPPPNNQTQRDDIHHATYVRNMSPTNQQNITHNKKWDVGEGKSISHPTPPPLKKIKKKIKKILKIPKKILKTQNPKNQQLFPVI